MSARLPIPRSARERVVARYPSGKKSQSKYYSDGKLLAEVLWEEDGKPYTGWQIRDRKRHGLCLEWWPNGELAFSERYVDGTLHGPARHWDDRGKLLLETRYLRGTGVDLWCELHTNRTLAEETRIQHGRLHGVRRQWSNWRSVWLEEHYFEGQEHGIFRQWNNKGRLARGFPQYFVRGRRVDRRAYLRAAKTDKTLPAWRSAENRPYRSLPAEILQQPVYLERSAPRRG
jgi:hypothetical protein